jgi:hypothetical protein
MGAGDLFIAALILAATVYLLYRSLFRTKGGCHGCSGGGCRRPPESTVVQLGAPPRPHDGARPGPSRFGP